MTNLLGSYIWDMDSKGKRVFRIFSVRTLEVGQRGNISLLRSLAALGLQGLSFVVVLISINNTVSMFL